MDLPMRLGYEEASVVNEAYSSAEIIPKEALARHSLHVPRVFERQSCAFAAINILFSKSPRPNIRQGEAVNRPIKLLYR